MKEKWNEFVFDLNEAKNRDADESEYHYIIESQLKLLGWLKSRGEICHKANIPIGNNNFIQPDILIKKDGTDLFVIEVKRPVHNITERERQQLISYMRQLKLNVGIYIGEFIEVLYDKLGSQEVEPVLAVELEFDEPNGEQFVKLFDRLNYDQDAVVGFCEEQLKKQEQKKGLLKIRDQLFSEGNSIIMESLQQYLSEKYNNVFSEDSLIEMLSSLKFNVSFASEDPINEIQHVPSVPTGITSKVSHLKGGGLDYSKYVLNGSYSMGKGEFVLAVVKEYIKLHPEKTYTELETTVFKPQFQLGGNKIDSLKGSDGPGVIRSLSFIKQKNYVGKRYHDEVLYSADKVPFKVCTEWGTNNIGNIVELAKRLGFKVTVL